MPDCPSNRGRPTTTEGQASHCQRAQVDVLPMPNGTGPILICQRVLQAQLPMPRIAAFLGVSFGDHTEEHESRQVRVQICLNSCILMLPRNTTATSYHLNSHIVRPRPPSSPSHPRPRPLLFGIRRASHDFQQEKEIFRMSTNHAHLTDPAHSLGAELCVATVCRSLL